MSDLDYQRVGDSGDVFDVRAGGLVVGRVQLNRHGGGLNSTWSFSTESGVAATLAYPSMRAAGLACERVNSGQPEHVKKTRR